MLNRTIFLRNLLALAILLAGVFFTLATSRQTRAAPARTATASASEYALPQGKDPWGTAMGKNGNLWVAVPGCDPSPYCSQGAPPGRFDIFNSRTSRWTKGHGLPKGFAQPLFLAFDKNNNIWFPMPMNNSIGMFNAATHAFHQWTVPSPASGPWDIAIDTHGYVWFTEHYSYKIGRFDPTMQTFIEIPTPAKNSQPYGITIDATNNVWFTENNSSVALIAEYTTRGQLLEYKIRTGIDGSLTPHLITMAKDGNIWWTEGFVGELGELKIAKALPGTNQGVSEYPYPQVCSGCGEHTSGIGVDSQGQIWFDDSLQDSFGKFAESGIGTFSMYTTPSSGSHPHDGLMVDSQDRVWFDEEFVNKIARAA